MLIKHFIWPASEHEKEMTMTVYTLEKWYSDSQGTNSVTWEMHGVRVKTMYQFRYVSSEIKGLPSGKGMHSLKSIFIIETLCYGMECERDFSTIVLNKENWQQEASYTCWFFSSG